MGAPYRTFSPGAPPPCPEEIQAQMRGRWRRRDRAGSDLRAGTDIVVESVVHAYVLTECPEGVTIATLALHFDAEFDQGVEGSAVERAVRELVRDRRLRMQGARVVVDRPGRGRRRRH